MKRKAIPVLAIALTASTVACSGAVADPIPSTTETPTQTPSSLQTLNEELSTVTLPAALERRDHFRPLCDAKGYPLVGNINSKGGATVTEFCAAVRELEAPPKPAPTCDSKALNEELSCCTMLEDAITNRARFRCLCDEQGYPLVGNINSKGTTASQFCQTLREKNLL